MGGQRIVAGNQDTSTLCSLRGTISSTAQLFGVIPTIPRLSYGESYVQKWAVPAL
ncbi:MAG: hypothetical protein L0H94_07430 [Nitrospira sp.]|nr:hypothetical protein [Nitrospira sp.]